MIGYIKGTYAYAVEEGIVVDNHGIGYVVKVPSSVLLTLPEPGGEIMLYTYTYVREDAIGLFGFSTLDELQVFRLLITVNGIGPKGGLSILSTMTTDNLRYAVMMDDAGAIAKAPGVGAKTAAKLILELKGKLGDKEELLRMATGQKDNLPANEVYTAAMEEAVLALVSLGYKETEAKKAVMAVPEGGSKTVEELLSLSLKNF